ncbi:MAG: hypothetical protein IGS50_13585 [Synechococcales cyanobacterium C42_A2020_086]|jgi:hypothetical protein|nr:hypothetical protein [Synechococcales cyanobacterium C42_A2020_086]
MRFQQGDPLELPPLPPYEAALLSSLAFFRKQERKIQALNCLTMYLRQSEARVLGELKFYARTLNMDPQDLLRLIHHDPVRAETLLREQMEQADAESAD